MIRASLTAAVFVASSLIPARAEVPEQVATLVPDDGAPGDEFGQSVGIDLGIAIVGAPRHESGVGAAYLFDAATGTQITKVVPGGGNQGLFGIAVDISGSIAIVGAPLSDYHGQSSGVAYLYDTATGNRTATLIPDDLSGHDLFGGSVAIDGPIAIVGASGHDRDGRFTGSAYLFDVASGTQTGKLLASDGRRFDLFGGSVAIDGTTAVVGAYGKAGFTGAAYVFDATTGAELAKLTGDGTLESFGVSVGVSGSKFVVGARFNDTNGIESGAAYLFESSNDADYTQLAANDGAAFDRFGSSVGIGDPGIFVGAILDDGVEMDSGSAYVFDARTGSEPGKLSPSVEVVGARFGISIDVAGFVIVGAPGGTTGAAYVFKREPR